MRKSPNPYSEVVRARFPVATHKELRETSQRTGVPVSEILRNAATWYLSATKSNPNPQTSDKVTK